ncbi:PREDICTED: uncharacterized protein LOC106122893 isoform X1 [Papilio xuthus]|uniref:Uncharacterized protein LOC106122893 isoform X1 n=1 Tax=Papilio xuthus TaxID=66420 RepID=A0AAJ6ZKV2_PAPXU|nr:PREDICTED: uncharacterized protein LOC106122893 isoform X1 [Papilio xuthus]
MALVLKKAVSPKHLTLLQSISKRNYALVKDKHVLSASNGVRCPDLPNNADTSNGGPSSEDCKLASTSENSNDSKPCSVITRLQRKLTSSGYRCSSKSHFRHAFSAHKRRRSSKSLLAPITPRANYVRSFASGKGCPCPCPCPSCCGNLPPPCNQPPRCIQCMTGYYYYPYGYWFCGPYHVTGQCCPVGPGGICPKPCPPTPACVCPTAAAVMPSFDQNPKPPFTEQSTETSIPKSPLQSSNTSISEAGARKAGRSSFSNFFPFPTDSKKERKPKSGPSRKSVNPTLQSSFFCVPYKFKTSNDPMDAGTGSDRAKSHIIKQNLHVRVDNARHHSHVASYRPKRCKYMGYINPLTLPRNTKDRVKNLDKLMDSKL